MADSFQDRPYFDASTDDLTAELMTRGSAVIVLMARPKRDHASAPGLEVYRRVAGTEVELKGLVAHIQDHFTITDLAHLLEKMGEQFNDPEPGDPL